MSGNIAYDGSCQQRRDPALSRAGWAVVEMGINDTVTATFSGAIPRHLPQSAQAAEYTARARAVSILNGPSRLFGDCLNVVKDALDPSARPESQRRMYAGENKACRRSERLQHVLFDEWMPSHRKLDDNATAVDRLKHAANSAADDLAKQARERPPANKAISDRWNTIAAKRDAHAQICRLIGSMQVVWHALPKDPRCTRPAVLRRTRAGGRQVTRLHPNDHL
jgi:ribonuclease HI